MDLAYAAADLIVSRAGAMTCYEILATGKPSILDMRVVAPGSITRMFPNYQLHKVLTLESVLEFAAGVSRFEVEGNETHQRALSFNLQATSSVVMLIGGHESFSHP
ncbi:UDP-Glycosyltransferase superfamily protein [Actinidia rufa]|uniref:UDP-Glycosyltransferase superfamily protein n=1 Tax=Actinidia rufa TaxID=165716 RepID=A0A7J0DKI6_9ERIC|nr:UDP-Glycosyltransferase superfamily protein [Actinidia rufa]